MSYQQLTANDSFPEQTRLMCRRLRDMTVLIRDAI